MKLFFFLFISLLSIQKCFCNITPSSIKVVHSSLLDNNEGSNLLRTNCSEIEPSPFKEQFHSITLESEIEQEIVLRFKPALLKDFKIWLTTDDNNLKLIFDIQNKQQPNSYERSTGVPLFINLKKKHPVNIIYALDKVGLPINLTYNIQNKNTFLDEINFENNLKLTCRTIVISLLCISIILGLILKDKVFFIYTITFFSAFSFYETEYGLISNLLPQNYFTTLQILLLIFSYVYLLSSVYLYHLMVFSSLKIIPIKIQFLLKIIACIGVLSFCVYILNNNEDRYYNIALSLVAVIAIFPITFIVLYIIITGILQRKKEAFIVLFFFLITNSFIINYYVAPNLGLLSIIDFDVQLIFYLICTLNTVSYLLLILTKTSSIVQQKNEIQLQKQLIQEQYSLAIIKGQENERNQIGKELHDHVGGNLAIISKSDDLSSQDVKNIIKNTIHSVRHLSHELVSPEFDREDFQDIIYDLCSKYSSKNLRIHINYSIEKPIHNLSLKNHCYRIIQDLLSKAYQNDEVMTIFIDLILSKESSELNIFYEDKYRTQNTDQHTQNSKLKNITFRVNALGGKMSYNHSNEGTYITISNIKIQTQTV